MKINQVMKETGLTKKAIYYYESEGLISPAKEPGNNYRIYTDEEVKKLIKISILRRLDVPIKSIGEILSNSVPIKNILKEQLVLTNYKINVLLQNKMVLNKLIMKDIEDADFSIDTLKSFDLELDRIIMDSGCLGKELELIFPGTLGKLFAVFYNNFLNVHLDTKEKIAAWSELVHKLDEMQEIEFPMEIKHLVEELYGEAEQERTELLMKINGQIIGAEFSKNKFPERNSILMAKESLEGYYARPENQKRIEGYYMLQNFILNNLYAFKEIDPYMGIINERYLKHLNRHIESAGYNNG
jgi:DNA-binding transcriptional MerR regulator